MVLNLAISRQKNLAIKAKMENCFGVIGEPATIPSEPMPQEITGIEFY